MDATVADILPGQATFSPEDEAAFFAQVPAKWCVALLCDAAGEPLQLMCAKNLRATLKRRLGAPDPNEPALPTKRVDYRELVRSARWQRVDGELEMDLAYVDAARICFPAHWRRLVPERSAYFVACEALAPAPDFVRDTTPNLAGQVFGPFADKAKADRWIDAIRDAFDLCRYRNILAQAPNGKACAYKQMHKCPAPCDGSISMETFRERNVQPAIDAARAPAGVVAALTDEMKRAAAALEFEQAGRLKQRADAIQALAAGAFKGVRPIEQFRFVSVQPGPRKGTAKLFAMTADGVAEVASVIHPDAGFEEAVQRIDAVVIPKSSWPQDLLLGTICFHLGGARSAERFAERERLDESRWQSLVKAATTKAETKEKDVAEPVRETRLNVAI